MKKVLFSSLVGAAVTLLSASQSLGEVINVGGATDFSKTLAVSSGGTLTMNVGGGDVHIIGGEQNTVEIRVQRHVTRASDSDAAKILEEEDVEIKQTGNRISITAQEPPGLQQSGGKPNLEVHYEIAVPRQFDARVETPGGDVKVDAPLNDMIAQLRGRVPTPGGDVKVDNVHGNVNVQIFGGDD